MEQKQRLFIYDRKEVSVLMALGVMVAVFAFTLGVHLGKRVGPPSASAISTDSHSVPGVNDNIPSRPELSDQAKAASQAADETLSQSLHDEVARTGIRMDTPRQVELPTTTKSKNAGATTLTPNVPPVELLPEGQRTAPDKFTLQVGSFPTIQEAKDQTDALEALNLKPFMREAKVKGKGKWFRVFLGGYPAKEAAEKAGERYRAQHILESFIVVNSAEAEKKQ